MPERLRADHGLGIRREGLVLLAANAKVVGHIMCRSVEIFDGASLVGTHQAPPAGATQSAGLR